MSCIALNVADEVKITMKLKKQYTSLRLILGDQLNSNHSWYKNKNEDTLYVLAELKQEQDYVKHHVQKICAFFHGMENFAKALIKSGHHCLHLSLDDTKPFKDLNTLLQSLAKEYSVSHLQYQAPDEYRLRQQLSQLKSTKTLTVKVFGTEHFLLPEDELKDYFSEGKHHKMEFFYRKMRKRFNLLMEGDEPTGGQWNYDSDNRNALKKADIDSIPKPLLFSNDVSDILERLKRNNVNYFGKATEALLWPTSRQQALQLLEYFCQHCLVNFGRFQDAMTCQSEHQWSLYHSRLSFALNSKILHPLQVIQQAIESYENSKGAISLAQIEGFVRQILGWREYVRGVYWVNMPAYASKNTLGANRQLPEYFWNGNTRMRCMQQSIGQSLDYAYAHHIQRLMITGNFCLLTGINPDEVDQWYLGVYIDAIEWVEMPNTRGMSQFADDGIVATKPYTAGGNYINKMSDYCKSCDYRIKEKTGEDACPFNSLYWRFMAKHRSRLEKNPRIGMVYRNWDKQTPQSRKATLDKAEYYIQNLEKL